jgi:phage-related protein
MADGSVIINADIDDDGISRGLAKIKAKLKTLNTALLKTAALGAAITLGSALIPAAAAATAGVMALGASLAAAGIGAAAFGAVAVGVIQGVFDASTKVAELEEKIANADTWEEKVAAQKELAAVYDGMTESQKNALTHLQSFKKFWGEFIKQFESPVLTTFINSLNFVQLVLERLAPTIWNVAQVISEFMEKLAVDVRDGGFAKFFEWLEVNAAESLRNFLTIAGNVLGGFFELLMAFSPLGASMEEGLVKLTEKFKNWAASLSENPAFQNFINYVKENGPVLMDVIGNIIQIGKDLIVALAPLGAEVLQALQWLTDKLTEISPYFEDVVEKALDFVAAIQDNWPVIRETIIGVGVAVGSFLTIMNGLKIIGVINTLIAAYRAGTLLATAAQMGLNLAMLANPITWIVAAIAVLIAIGVLLYRNWDVVKEKAGQLWDWMKDVWAGIVDACKVAVEAIKAWWEPIGQWFVDMWTGISEWFVSAWETIKNVFEVAWLLIKEIISVGIEFITEALQEWGIADYFAEKWGWISNFLSSIWEGIKTAAIFVWDAIKSYFIFVFNFYKTIITGVWDFIKPYLEAAWNWIKNTAVNVFNAIKEFLSGVWNGIKNTVTSIWEGIKSKASEVWQGMKDTITRKVDETKSSAESKFTELKEKIMTPIREAKDKIKGFIDEIVGFFKNMNISFPKIKMPHFKASGKFSLDPPSVPKLSVDWYAKGGLFPANSPRLVGLGDNKSYQEAALPLSPKVLGMIGNKIADTMPQGGGSNRPVVIENVLIMDSYEVARSSKQHLDTMATNDFQMYSRMMGEKL